MTEQTEPQFHDWGGIAQQAAEDHLTRVWEAFHSEDPEVDDPAIGAFDGCQTCEIREVLMVALPIIAEGILAGQVSVEELASGNLARISPQPINIVFDGPPGPESGRFIEVETDDGHGIKVGQWFRDEARNYWALRITSLAPETTQEHRHDQ